MMSNYAAMAKRIRNSATIEQLDKCDKSLTRLWDNGIFTQSEFSRLDDLIFHGIQDVSAPFVE